MVILTQDKNILVDGVLIHPRKAFGDVLVVATSIVSGKDAQLAVYKTLDDAKAAIMELYSDYQRGVLCSAISDKGKAEDVLV